MKLNIVGYCQDSDCSKLIFECGNLECKFCKIHCIMITPIIKGICPHGRPKRSKLGVNIAKFGSQILNWEKNFFCKGCKWYVGYYSKIVLRTKERTNAIN